LYAVNGRAVDQGSCVVAFRQNRINAEEAARLAEGRYSSGLGTFLDVLDAQNAVLTAKTNLVNAQSALSVANVGLRYATGSVLAQQQNNQPAK
jgi:outer membrane protein TolC